MSGAGSRRWFVALLKAWALSPLAVALVLVVRAEVHPGRLWLGDSRHWALDLDVGASPVPVPDAARTSLRHTLSSGEALRQGQARIAVVGGARREELPAVFFELTAPDARILLRGVRSSFFGPDASDATFAAAMRATLAGGDEPHPLLRASDTAGPLQLQFTDEPAYQRASVVRAIELPRSLRR